MFDVKVFGPFDNIHHFVRSVISISEARATLLVHGESKAKPDERPLSSQARDIEREVHICIRRLESSRRRSIRFIRFDLAFHRFIVVQNEAKI